MFRNKSEIDKHVFGLLYKAKNENERNLRCFHIAKLYHKIQDYESVQRYILMYLSSHDDSAAAHKLLGQALEGLGQKEKAIAAYTKSLKLESDQSDLISKVCELLCDKDVEFDPVAARYWYERASLIFPHSLPVLMLKEKLLTADSSSSSKDVEELLHAELKKKPTDVAVRMKLLKLYAESGRSEIALNHAFEVESRRAHSNCFPWYHCLYNIYSSYNRDHFAKCGWEFYVQWLTALDRMCLLAVAENLVQPSCELTVAIECVYNLDQALYSANLSSTRTEKYNDFLKLMSAQLAYLLGTLLLKKTKKDNSPWKETKRLVSPLFLFAANLSLKIDQNWLSSLLNDAQQKVLGFWIHQVHSRQVQAGHFLLHLVKENNSEKMFLDKVSQFSAGDWRRQVWEKSFGSVGDKKLSSSHFMTSADYARLPLKVPSSHFLKPAAFASHFETAYFGSLHHLVWLGLRGVKRSAGGGASDLKLTPSFQTTNFKSLQFTISNLNNIGVETINQLDIDSFLYTTIFCTASILDENKGSGSYSTGDRPEVLPADISTTLCTPEQAKWWLNLCTLVRGGYQPVGSNESMSEVRFSLQRGLEVVRGEGLTPLLVVTLARTFAARSAQASSAEESEGCGARALHLWKVAHPILERLASNKLHFTPKLNPLFEYPIKNISSTEAKSILEEARYFIGCHHLKAGQYEKAVEELKGLKSPQALYHLAIVYQRWAEQGLESGTAMDSDSHYRQSLLASKARDYLLEAKSSAKSDSKNPLHGDIECQLAEIEDLLARIQPENGTDDGGVNGGGGGGGGTSPGGSAGSSSPEGLPRLPRSANPRSSVRHHTSTPRRAPESRMNLTPINMSEIVDFLSVQQSTNQLKMQEVLEQIKLIAEKMDGFAAEQRAQRNLIDGLLSRFNSFEGEIRSSVSDIKKDIKKPDFNNMFDDDDYDEMLQYQGYQQYYNPTTQRGLVQNAAAAAAAAAPPPPAVPYMNQFFSPRLDPLVQGFYTGGAQGALPFSEGQQLPDFLRQQKVGAPLLHSLPPAPVVPPPQLNLASTSAGVPGPSRLPAPPASSVLITTADSLTTITPSAVLPQLSVNIPTSLKSAISTSNAPHNFQIPLPEQPKPPVVDIEERPADEETPPPTYDPMPDYKPIVPLPDEIEVHTGEEDEEVLFERRAKLFRFTDKMWKERGVGNLKILRNKSTNKVRLLMRRDQVHKICANHILTPDMELKPKVNTENAWVWVANDFAEEKIQTEQFCAKFKTKDDSDEFKATFDEAKLEKSASCDTSVSSEQPPAPSLVETPKTTMSAAVFGFGSGFSSALGTTTFGQGPTFTFGESSLKPQTSETKLSTASNLTKPQPDITKTQLSSVITSKPQQAPVNKSEPVTVASLLQAKKVDDKTSTPGSVWGLRAPANVSTTDQKPGSIWGLRTSTTPENKTPPTSLTSNQTSPPSNQAQPAKVGGFTFSLAQPKFKPPESVKESVPETTSKEPSPFTKFTFGFSSTEKPKDTFSGFSNLGSTTKTELPNPFAVHKSPKPTAPVTSSSQSEKNIDEEKCEESEKGDNTENSEFVPTATFQPVIPLPDLIAVKTGEENEEIVFEERAQLYRFCRETKAWKERGIGQIKILKHPDTGAYRLLMRREQVLKVCCNHRITPDMSLKLASSSDRVFSWAAKDHSEETPTDELFSLKFKKVEQAVKFREEFEKAQAVLKSHRGQSGGETKTSSQPSLASLVKKPPGSWECKSCYVQNKTAVDKCASCSAAKGGSQTAPSHDSNKSLAELLKPKAGSWECGECYVRNSAETDACASCGKVKPGSAPKTIVAGKPAVTFSFGIPQTTTFSQATSSSTKPVKSLDKVDASQKSLAELLKPAAGSWECSECYVRNSAAVDVCASCGKLKPGAAPTKPSDTSKPTTPFSFGIPKPSEYQNQSSGFSISDVSPAVPFTFGAPTSIFQKSVGGLFDTKATTDGSPAPFTFGGGFTIGTSTPQHTEDSAPSSATLLSKTGFDFSSPNQPSTLSNEYSFGSKTFQFEMPPSMAAAPTSPGNTSQHDESGYDPEEEENHVQFQPVVPLPDKVDVITGEENEIVLYSQRAKLFRYDETAKEWKERGLGDIKILQHRDTGKVRFLMRREPVMKVCLNHVLCGDLLLRAKDEKSWMWYAVDFSEGAQKNEKFAIRFKSQDIAQVFKEEVDKAKLVADTPPSASAQLIKHESDPSKDTARESGSSSDYDVEFVSEKKSPPELVAKALSLQLPPNYYNYLEKPKCRGCIGCDRDDSSEDNEKASEKPELKESKTKESSQFSKNLFGSVEPVSIFGSTASTPQKSAGFTFGQAFTTPTTDGKSQESSGQKGFLFNQVSFTSMTPQKNIFSSANSSNTNQSPSFLNNAENLQSFSSLSPGENLFAKAAENFKWDGAGAPVFGSFQIDVKKKPFPLPGKVFKATEEECELVFCERGSLFKRGKEGEEPVEAGSGELKILHHKAQKVTFLFMRRDNDNKIICNCALNKDFILTAGNGEEPGWQAVSHGDGSSPQLFSIKFTNPESDSKFKAAVLEASSTK